MMILKEKDKKGNVSGKGGKEFRSFKAIERDMWEVFSLYIRIRDSDVSGMCRCFTCGVPKYWEHGDCGHGVGRGHGSTKYNERNNHFQCKGCNGFNEGRKDLYEKAMDRKYGVGTWALMWQASKQRSVLGRWEFEQLTVHYAHEVRKMMLGKKFVLPAKKEQLVGRFAKVV